MAEGLSISCSAPVPNGKMVGVVEPSTPSTQGVKSFPEGPKIKPDRMFGIGDVLPKTVLLPNEQVVVLGKTVIVERTGHVYPVIHNPSRPGLARRLNKALGKCELVPLGRGIDAKCPQAFV